jgi:hypothetical protein
VKLDTSVVQNKQVMCLSLWAIKKETTPVIIIIIIIIIITTSFMQGIYTYIPETNNAPREYNVAAILSLLFMMPTSLVPAYYYYYYY